jgi:acetoin utilization deacetylase AcuC-like enzyme
MLRPIALCVTLCLALVVTGCGDTPESVTKKMISKMQAMADVLKTVKDEPSAKAAAPKIKALSADLKEIQKKMEAMKPSEAEQKRLAEAHMKPMMEAMGQLMQEVMRIGMDPKLQTPEIKAALKEMDDVKPS